MDSAIRADGWFRGGLNAEVYNYFRDYEPGIGRYVQSDRIGLKGGLNTFLYASAQPLSFVDVFGLSANPSICNGKDCADPPFDAGPNGPGPSPQPKGGLDKDYGKWLDKCVEGNCKAFEAGSLGNWCCKKLSKWACGQAGRNLNCCDCVLQNCRHDRPVELWPTCQSQFLLCMGRKQ